MIILSSQIFADKVCECDLSNSTSLQPGSD